MKLQFKALLAAVALTACGGHEFSREQRERAARTETGHVRPAAVHCDRARAESLHEAPCAGPSLCARGDGVVACACEANPDGEKRWRCRLTDVGEELPLYDSVPLPMRSTRQSSRSTTSSTFGHGVESAREHGTVAVLGREGPFQLVREAKLREVPWEPKTRLVTLQRPRGPARLVVPVGATTSVDRVIVTPFGGGDESEARRFAEPPCEVIAKILVGIAHRVEVLGGGQTTNVSPMTLRERERYDPGLFESLWSRVASPAMSVVFPSGVPRESAEPFVSCALDDRHVLAWLTEGCLDESGALVPQPSRAPVEWSRAEAEVHVYLARKTSRGPCPKRRYFGGDFKTYRVAAEGEVPAAKLSLAPCDAKVTTGGRRLRIVRHPRQLPRDFAALSWNFFSGHAIAAPDSYWAEYTGSIGPHLPGRACVDARGAVHIEHVGVTVTQCEGSRRDKITEKHPLPVPIIVPRTATAVIVHESTTFRTDPCRWLYPPFPSDDRRQSAP